MVLHHHLGIVDGCSATDEVKWNLQDRRCNMPFVHLRARAHTHTHTEPVHKGLGERSGWHGDRETHGVRLTSVVVSSFLFCASSSPTTRTLITLDLSRISWMMLPFLPITLPEKCVCVYVCVCVFTIIYL